jgi:hypothetical protein
MTEAGEYALAVRLSRLASHPHRQPNNFGSMNSLLSPLAVQHRRPFAQTGPRSGTSGCGSDNQQSSRVSKRFTLELRAEVFTTPPLNDLIAHTVAPPSEASPAPEVKEISIVVRCGFEDRIKRRERVRPSKAEPEFPY